MLPNTACDILVSYLLVSIKKPSYLAQNLSFCELDIWDNVLLINCPSKEVFDFILKSQKALINAIDQQLPEIKVASVRWHTQVTELKIDYLISRQTKRPEVSHLVFDIADLIKQSAYPILVTKLDGQILFAYSSKTNENFPVESIYLSDTEANRMAVAVESHGWVNGYRLKLENRHDCRGGIFTIVRARYVKNTPLNELVLLIQVLNIESIGAVPSRDVA